MLYLTLRVLQWYMGMQACAAFEPLQLKQLCAVHGTCVWCTVSGWVCWLCSECVLGPQAKGVNHLETPPRPLHATHRASSCAKGGGHVQLCSKPRGARGIEPETFRRRVGFYQCLSVCGCMLRNDSFLHSVASPFHSFVITIFSTTHRSRYKVAPWFKLRDVIGLRIIFKNKK